MSGKQDHVPPASEPGYSGPVRQRRVLMLTADLGGGTGNHMLAMLTAWDKSRWNVEIVSQKPLTAREQTAAPVVFMPRHKRLNRYPFAQLRDVRYLMRLEAVGSSDLLHTYFFWPIVYGRLLKRLGRVRVLVENREDQGFDWGGHEYAMLRLTRAMPDKVICVSEAVREVVLRKERLDPKKVIVIPNGLAYNPPATLDKERLKREMDFALQEPVVGMVANLNRPIKGVEYFLEAMPAIAEAVPSVRFLIVGSGRLEPAFRARAADLGLQSRVLFAGFQKDISRYYAVMDVSVLTSLSEGLSITLLESMAHRLPVVVTRVGGNPEVVIEGDTGFLVPPKDVRLFAERVIQLLRDGELRSRMGEAGYKRIQKHFRIAVAASRYLEIYDEVLHGD